MVLDEDFEIRLLSHIINKRLYYAKIILNIYNIMNDRTFKRCFQAMDQLSKIFKLDY